MSDEIKGSESSIEEQKQKTQEVLDQKKKEKEIIRKKLEERGVKQFSLAEHEAMKAKQARKGRFKLPTHLKIILRTPFLIIFCCGVIIIPYMLYLIATGKPKEVKPETEQSSTYRENGSKITEE